MPQSQPNRPKAKARLLREMGLRNGRAPLLVLLADVIFSLRLRSAGAEKAALSCQAASAVNPRHHYQR